MKANIATLKDATDILRKRGYKIQLMPGPNGTHVAVGDYQYTSLEVIFLVQNDLEPGTLIWSRVAFNSDVAEVEATGVMSAVVAAYREANLPAGTEVFRAPATGGIVYYFSPQAAMLLPSSVKQEPCEKPDTSHMRKVTL